MISSRFRKIAYLLIAAVLFLIPVFLVQRHFITDLYNPSWGDMVSMPNNPVSLTSYMYLWYDQFTGTFGTIRVPDILLSQFTKFVSPHVLQIVSINSYLIILYCALFVILKKLGMESINQRLLYSVMFLLIFLFSNVNIVNYVQGQFETIFTYVMALILFFYLFFVLKDQSVNDLLTLILLFLIAGWYNWLSFFYIGFFMSVEFIVLSIVFLTRKQITIKKYIAIGLFIFIALFLTNINTFYQIYFNLSSAVKYKEGSFGSANSLKNEMYYMYENSTFLNSFYNVGNKGDISRIFFDYQSRSLDINYLPFAVFSLVDIALIVYLFLLSYRTTKPKVTNNIDLLIFISIISYILIAVLIYLIFMHRADILIDKVHFFNLYRNPKKFLLSLYLYNFILYILFLMKLNGRKYLGILTAIVVLSFLAKYSFLTTGYLGEDIQYRSKNISSSQADDFKTIFVNEATYPSYFKELNTILDVGEQRVIVLPNNSQTLYESFLRYDFPIFHIQANADLLSGANVQNNVMSILYTKILNRENVDNLLKIGNVKYIIVDRKSPYYLWDYSTDVKVRSFGSIWMWGDPEVINERLQAQNLKLIYKDAYFYVYATNVPTDSKIYIPMNTVIKNDSGDIMNNADLFLDNTNYKIHDTAGSVISEIQKNSPTSYNFKLETTAGGEIPIFFSEKYSNNWKLTIKNKEGTVLHPQSHELGNYFGNTWFVKLDSPGTYYGEITLTLQQVNTYLSYITLVSIGGLLLAKVYFSVKSRKL